MPYYKDAAPSDNITSVTEQFKELGEAILFFSNNGNESGKEGF